MGRLQEHMRADLLLKRFSPHTMRAYLRCIRHFAKYFMCPPEDMGVLSRDLCEIFIEGKIGANLPNRI